ncbi:hypothetical protein A3A64_02940 [Candidatus Gottesmanbacteria bacterium RIFCSPLOWO2_01_FULL_48_11]|uniref:Uncharacterized protein n=2 Tax=Candidatus Gottesmaniibacteriota TaxID=1752720 RepID=A0A0G1U0Q8_9BACT|nr:MAG: hypothetical protein UY16_C0021G0017 [Candidatus Gottesmanbacteria bacterium GW2011_GWA2_47_9]OGG27566.1 MAG: hypothetical protein A3A64_02940 [Candidatus Gottesmanbacteria bacterium RIFCSPLOWO2_01_FULL_48_11]
MSPDDIRQQIELQVVELIKARTADGSMSEERSQAVSQRTLDLLQPGMSLEELYRAISKLDDNAPELSPIVLPYLRDYETNVTQKAHEEIRRLMSAGQFDAAAKLGEKAIKQDVQLVWEGRSNRPPAPPTRPTFRQNPFQR